MPTRYLSPRSQLAIAFFSLNASDSPPFRVLGNCVAFGVLCALVYTMTLLPALLSILPLRAPRVQSEGTAFFDRFADFVIARSTFLLGSITLVVVVLIIGIPRIELSDNMAQYFDERYQFRRDTDYIIDNLTGLDKLEYSLNAGREGGVTDPDYLRKVEAFAEWYRQQPEVTHVQAFSDIMKRLNKNMHGDDPAFYRLPEDPDLAAQYLLLYELSLPFGSDLNDRIDVAKSATRMVVVTKNAWSRDLRELDEHAQVWLHANAPDADNTARVLTVELNRRISNQWSLRPEAIAILGIDKAALDYELRRDSFIELNLIYNFWRVRFLCRRATVDSVRCQWQSRSGTLDGTGAFSIT